MTRQATVLFNATSVQMGGGVQATVSFVRYLLESDTGLHWHLALSRPVAEQLMGFGISGETLGADIFERAPAHDREARRTLKRIERDIQPRLVFTFFGPAYVRFRSMHLCGVADGWVTHSTSAAYSVLGFSRSARNVLQSIYKGLWFRAADRWVVEAEAARDGLVRRYRIPAERIAVIPNGCAAHYLNRSGGPPLLESDGRFRLLTFASYYPHKNLEIIPEVAAELARMGIGRDIEFILTIRNDEAALTRIEAMAHRLGVANMIRNIGQVDLIDGPSLYEACHAAFIPSLLETFSSAYPEAMAMGLPIIATDLDFARGVCGPAALYFQPKDARAAAAAIRSIYCSPTLRRRFAQEGARQLARFPTAAEKNGAIVALVQWMARAAHRRSSGVQVMSG